MREREIVTYYAWIREVSSVTKLAKGLGVKPQQVRDKIYQLNLSPQKRKRGNITELILSREEEEEIRRSFER